MDTDCAEDREGTKRRLRNARYGRQIVVQNRALGLVFTGGIQITLGRGRRDGGRIWTAAMGPPVSAEAQVSLLSLLGRDSLGISPSRTFLLFPHMAGRERALGFTLS